MRDENTAMDNRASGVHLAPGTWCYYVSPTEFDDGKGYVPCVVVEGESGHYPMRGNGQQSQPWYWGTEYAAAAHIAERENNKMGISSERATDIVMSSMRASGMWGN